MSSHAPAGPLETRLRSSEEWLEIFKAAGIKKTDLLDPVKAARINLALAESVLLSLTVTLLSVAAQPRAATCCA